MHRWTKVPVRLLATIVYSLLRLQTLSIGSYTEYLDLEEDSLPRISGIKSYLQSIEIHIKIWIGDIIHTDPPRKNV